MKNRISSLLAGIVVTFVMAAARTAQADAGLVLPEGRVGILRFGLLGGLRVGVRYGPAVDLALLTQEALFKREATGKKEATECRQQTANGR